MKPNESTEEELADKDAGAVPANSSMVSRRKLLSAMGLAGAAAAAAGMGLNGFVGTASAKSPHVALQSKVESASSITYLQSATTSDYYHVSVAAYHTGSELGGGLFYWDATRAKSQHNGGTIISPTVPWNGQYSTLATYLAGTGETQPAGTGCWLRMVDDSISSADFGAAAGQNITAPMQAASETATALSVRMFGGVSGSLTGDVLLPKMFDGAGAQYTGGRLIVRMTKYADICNFTCSELLAQAVWHANIRSIQCDTFTVDGYDGDWGSFWNKFENIRSGQIVLDCQAQAVNANEFLKCNGNAESVYGLLITDRGAPGPATSEAHGNNFIGCDFSVSLGVHNATPAPQQNILTNCYLERGALVNGNFLILGMTMDGNSPPAVSPLCHVIGMTQQNAATRGDMLSLALSNSAIGGDWSVRDSNDKPPAFSASFPSATTALSSSPYGYKAAYGGTATGAWQFMDINFEVSTKEFSSTIWLYSPTADLPVAIVVVDKANNAESYRDTNFYNYGGGFYLLRISGKMTGPAGIIRLLYTTGSSSTFTAYLGSVYISAYKGAPLPYYAVSASPVESIVCGGAEIKRGIKEVPLTSSGYTDVTITFGAGFSTTPSFTYSLCPASAYYGNLSKSELHSVTPQSAVVRIYYTTGWAGEMHWQAV
ncbi:hypothetical protein [Paenibacillus eucommiae]|uniref:Uncharacterized protein n=1 Tax=Paenibacillus eucommiae TaxID=1355755 RepID=A0ABS4IT73_9BACL|nr:hypothetical protein [Paenibacillus eucommiae]MBP1990757.1 hypothetical protein [Paenibacillus eucommiae]